MPKGTNGSPRCRCEKMFTRKQGERVGTAPRSVPTVSSVVAPFTHARPGQATRALRARFNRRQRAPIQFLAIVLRNGILKVLAV